MRATGDWVSVGKKAADLETARMELRAGGKGEGRPAHADRGDRRDKVTNPSLGGNIIERFIRTEKRLAEIRGQFERARTNSSAQI
jgi:hypothetical protein